MEATLPLKLPLIAIADSGSVASMSQFVNIQSKDTTPSNDFDRPDLDDLLEIIKILVDQIIAKNRKRINKKAVPCEGFYIIKRVIKDNLLTKFQIDRLIKKRIPP